jgi:ribosomal protein L24
MALAYQDCGRIVSIRKACTSVAIEKKPVAVQGVPKKRKLLKSLIVKIEFPIKKLNVMMRKILTRCMY